MQIEKSSLSVIKKHIFYFLSCKCHYCNKWRSHQTDMCHTEAGFLKLFHKYVKKTSGGADKQFSVLHILCGWNLSLKAHYRSVSDGYGGKESFQLPGLWLVLCSVTSISCLIKLLCWRLVQCSGECCITGLWMHTRYRDVHWGMAVGFGGVQVVRNGKRLEHC